MTVAAGLVLGVFAISRVFGRLWFYLSLWAWSIAVLAAVAMAWTVVLAVRRRAPGAGSERALRLAAGGAALLGIVAVAHSAIEAQRCAPLRCRRGRHGRFGGAVHRGGTRRGNRSGDRRRRHLPGVVVGRAPHRLARLRAAQRAGAARLRRRRSRDLPRACHTAPRDRPRRGDRSRSPRHRPPRRDDATFARGSGGRLRRPSLPVERAEFERLRQQRDR